MSLLKMTIAILTNSTTALADLSSHHRSLTTRQSSDPATIDANIQGWQTDIANINAFLNTASQLSVSDLRNQATTLLFSQPGSAQDEANRLGALTALLDPNDSVAVDASNTLDEILGGVLANLTNIADFPGDADIVGDAVSAIDALRRNFVLPNIDLVYAGAVNNNPGATLQQTSGPDVCPQPFEGSF